MSDWSVWSGCSCVSQRQQRYRVALSPAVRGQQCTPVETQSRACTLSQCAGELNRMLGKMYCISAFYIFVLCFLLLTSNGFKFSKSMRALIHLDCSNSPRSFGRATGRCFLRRQLKTTEKCLPVFFIRPSTPPIDLSVYRVDFIFCLLCFIDCEGPFVYSACGTPCEKQCALRGHEDQCLGVQECTPGCYCPEVNLFTVPNVSVSFKT